MTERPKCRTCGRRAEWRDGQWRHLPTVAGREAEADHPARSTWAPSVGAESSCGRCGAAITWHVGPQWSGWRAPELDGHLRDVCYRDDTLTWYGHWPG